METMTAYQLSDMFKKAADLAGKIPHAVVEQCKTLKEDEMPRLVKKLNDTLQMLEALYANVETAEEKLCKRYDDMYDNVIKHRMEVEKKMKSLPVLEGVGAATYIPHNIKTVVEIAQQCAHLTDEQWQRVIDLAKAFEVNIMEARAERAARDST